MGLGLSGLGRRVALERYSKVGSKPSPPELRLTTDLMEHVKGLQARAEAFDKAMEEVTAISDQVQRPKSEAPNNRKLDENTPEQRDREAHLEDLTTEMRSLAVRIGHSPGVRPPRPAPRLAGQDTVWGRPGWAFGLAEVRL